jgi:hypothetical protein
MNSHVFRHRARLVAVAIAASLACASISSADEKSEAPPPPAAPVDPLLIESGPWKIKFGLFAGTQFVGESNGFWGLAGVFAPTANYDEDRLWNESWMVPGVRADYKASDQFTIYGGLALAATGNLGRDIFDQGNAGRVSLERAFAGVTYHDAASKVKIDLSGGQQEYRIGSGFLINLGAQNGNQRGVALVSPRKSWEYTGLLRASVDRFSADAFVLNYNQITSADADTTLVGGKLEYALSQDPIAVNDYIGVTYFVAVDSTMPYIRAPLAIIENGRDGTQTINPYLRLRPAKDSLPGLYTALDAAYQWNDSIDLSAYALSAEVGYQWESAKLRPKLSYAYRLYSGDKPGTSDLERFDAMFYDGGVHAFASGSNAALAFYNTNVQTHRVSLNLTMSPQDFLTVSYWRVSAAETNSPLQFGQAGRLENIDGNLALVSGVPTTHLSDDFYIEYVRALSANFYLTLGVGVSFPGSGLERQAGESLDPWVGGLVNFTMQF